jgi:hypothetical protein
MKKFMMIALITMGLMGVAAPESNAGVSIGIGFGFPVGYCGYPAYSYYPYAYPYGAPVYRPVVYYSPIYGPYYWWHGQRIYYRAHRR